MYAATVGGARSVALGDVIGSIRVGAKADLVLFNLRTVPFTPRNDLVKHLAYAENGASIAKVFVDGQLVVEDGRVLTVDEREVIDEIWRSDSSFLAQHEAAERSQEKFASYFAGAVRRATSGTDRRPRLIP
jgi:cytosine/adenosine deaminase-related metal-dependent hydrolase